MTQSDFFQQIKVHLKLDKPFVVYKMPNSTELIAQLQNTISVVEENFEEEGFLFAPFTKENHKSVWFSKKEATSLKTKYTTKINTSGGLFYNNLKARKGYIKIIDKALEYLKKGTLQKVVISRKELIANKIKDPLVYFQQMCTVYPNTFCYCWYHPKIGMWLGATPETLVKLKGNNFETMALAGTIPFHENKEVIWEEKEKEEQQFVVDSIFKELTPTTETIEIGKTVTQKAGSLLHLKTPILGQLRASSGLRSLVNLLHPTPAVCGLPKNKSKAFILANENYDRKYYTGYLGVLKPTGDSHLFVNLRCMEIECTGINIYIGGGITALSNPEKEWQETVNKSQIIKQIL